MVETLGTNHDFYRSGTGIDSWKFGNVNAEANQAVINAHMQKMASNPPLKQIFVDIDPNAWELNDATECKCLVYL